MRTLLVCLPAFALGAEVVVVGDSWGAEGKAAFADMFASRGISLSIQNIAVGGTTASQWASASWARKFAEAVTNETKHVWLTIGGNDLQMYLPLCGLPCVPDAVSKIAANVHTFVDPVLAATPSVTIVQFGYDVLIFNHYPLCSTLGPLFIPQCVGHGISCTNTNFLSAMRDLVANASSGNERHTTIDISGTLQKAGGVPDAAVGKPNVDFYSPYQLMQDNCIHPTMDRGFDLVMDSFFDLYWSHFYTPTPIHGEVTDLPTPGWPPAANSTKMCGQLPCLF